VWPYKTQACLTLIEFQVWVDAPQFVCHSRHINACPSLAGIEAPAEPLLSAPQQRTASFSSHILLI
jgi:hypothetical protein